MSYAQQPSRAPPFRVRVHSDHLFRSLVGDDRPSSPTESCMPSVKSRQSRWQSQDPYADGFKKRTADKRYQREQQYRLQLAQQKLIQDRQTKDKILEKACTREREFVRLSGEVASGQSFVKDLDRVLGIADEADRSKKLKQFEDWDANVHGVIQQGIDDVLTSMDDVKINQQRRNDLEKFLIATNTKAAVFRDIIIESEYDPLEPNRRAIKANVSRLRDPCSRVLDKRSEEQGLLSDESVSATKPSVKDTFDVELWADRRVKDTPHGFFAKMMGRESAAGKHLVSEARSNDYPFAWRPIFTSINVKGGHGKVSRTYQTSFVLDDYGFSRGKDIVTNEFPKGKKTYRAGDDFAPPSSEAKSLIGIG